MTKKQLANKFIKFLDSSPTPFHAVANMARILVKNGFKELDEKAKWELKEGGKYYVIRGASSLLAFRLGKGPLGDNGFHVVGAHTDSPSLKIKHNPVGRSNGYVSLGVEPYGGAILSTWFDRDLSIAGRVSYTNRSKKLCSTLIDFQKPIAILPNLAIHLDRKKNESSAINKQTDLPPVLMQETSDQEFDFKSFLKDEVTRQTASGFVKDILDYDLIFYDTHKAGFVGLNEEFIAGQQLDNLLSCFCGLQALIDTTSEQHCMLICNDNEEVGSSSFTGAAGTFLSSVIERICPDRETLLRSIAKSILVSADNAHGIHPNYASKHDENHKPLLNQGPVIKINANQRYATNSETSSYFRYVCGKAKVPVQSYIHRSDMACGSTIGPITSTVLGIETLDIGAPTFGMHSIRETCGSDDIWYTAKALKTMYETGRD